MKEVRSGGIYVRLFRYFLLVALIPILTLGCVSVFFVRQLSLNSVKSDLLSTTSTAAEGLSREMDNCMASLELFAQSNEVAHIFSGQEPETDELIQVNQKSYLILAGRSRWLDVQLVDLSGEILYSTSDHTGTPDTAHTYWGILRALQEKQASIIYPDTYGSGDRGLTIAVPVWRNDSITGYAMLCIAENGLAQMLETYGQHLPVKYILMDPNHYLLLDQVNSSEASFLPLELRQPLAESQGKCITSDFHNDPHLMVCVQTGSSDLELASMVSVGLVVSSNRELMVLVLLVCVIGFIFSLFAAQSLARRIVQPIHIICDTMEQIEGGAADITVPELWDDEFGMMAHSFNHMLSQLIEQFQMNMERQDRLRLAELKNLQAQISPHFLYNTLDSVKYMARLGMNAEIDTVISKLGILLRSGMNFKQDMILLREEMKVVESYVAIQQIRYPGKFSFFNTVSEDLLDCLVPNLVIQPLVENAVVHGIETKVGTGKLVISSVCTDEVMLIEVCDDGEGIPPEKLEEIFFSERTPSDGQSRESIGMANVHRRLQLYFGEQYGLRVESVPGQYTKVIAQMPRIKGGGCDVPSGDR